MRPYSSGVPLYLSKIGEQGRGLDRLGGKAQGRARPHGAGGLRHGSAVLGHQRAGHAVEGACAVDVVLHDLDARDLSRPDRRVHLVDGRLFEAEPSLLRTGLNRHARFSPPEMIGICFLDLDANN
jgi:hypothetical protein